MDKIKKNKFLVILISFISIVFIFSNSTSCYALGAIITGGDNFIQSGVTDTTPTIEEDDLHEMSNLLYSSLLIIAIVVAVIIGMIIGIKFMTASASEKAKVKETLVPYIAGCIVAFGAFAIWKLVVELLGSAVS